MARDSFEIGELIPGLEDFRIELYSLPVDVSREMEQVLVNLALRTMRSTKKRTPVDTGHLRRNWKVSDIKRQGSQLSVEIFNNAEYAEAVEKGHRTRNGRFIPGRFMLKISLEQLQRELPKYLRNELNRILRRFDN